MLARIRLNVTLLYIACIILSEVPFSNNLSNLWLSLAINFRKSSEFIFLLEMFGQIILFRCHTRHRLKYYEDDVQPNEVCYLNSTVGCCVFLPIPSIMTLLHTRIVPSRSTLTRETLF